jgi:hypothetical protein
MLLRLRNFLGTDFHLGSLELYDHVLDIVGSVPSRNPRKHQIDNSTLLADYLYGLVNRDVGIEMITMFFEDPTKIPIADP